MDKKAKSLYDRLLAIQAQLDKIKKVTNDMDGNTST